MKKRNYFMVDNSSVCAYYMVNPTRSGTAQTVNYARRSGCRLIDLMRLARRRNRKTAKGARAQLCAGPLLGEGRKTKAVAQDRQSRA